MAINYKDLEKKHFAQNKVYNAWQYVQSLNETLMYMNVSYEMLKKGMSTEFRYYNKFRMRNL